MRRNVVVLHDFMNVFKKRLWNTRIMTPTCRMWTEMTQIMRLFTTFHSFLHATTHHPIHFFLQFWWNFVLIKRNPFKNATHSRFAPFFYEPSSFKPQNKYLDIITPSKKNKPKRHSKIKIIRKNHDDNVWGFVGNLSPRGKVYID